MLFDRGIDRLRESETSIGSSPEDSGRELLCRAQVKIVAIARRTF